MDYIKEIKQINDENFLAIHLCENGIYGYDTVVLVNSMKGIKEIVNTRETQNYLDLQTIMNNYNIEEIIKNW